MKKKIYISLKEAERLIFDKILFVHQNRLQVQRAQKNLSIVIVIEEAHLIELGKYLIITAGCVYNYEIPTKEENLFLNHFRVPKGLVSNVDRNYRDDKPDLFNKEEEPEFRFEIEIFKSVRRALIQCFSLGVTNSISEKFSAEVLAIINSEDHHSDFETKLIREVIMNKIYPIKERNDGNFYPEAVKRFNWLGSYILSELPKIRTLTEEDINEGKAWLLNLKNKNDYDTIINTIKNVPDILFDEFEFIMGYYLACSFYEDTNIGAKYYDSIFQQIEKINLASNHKVLFWSIFFLSIFKEELDFLYLIPSLQKQQLEIERKIIKYLFPNIQLSSFVIERPEITKEQGVAEFIQMQDGGSLSNPVFIEQKAKQGLFENNISRKKMLNIGFGLADNSHYNNLFRNTCILDKTGFTLNLQSKPTDVIFYIRQDSELDIWLNALKIKTKPIEKLIDKNKKALLGFIKKESYQHSLFYVYEWLLSNMEKPDVFKAVVFILLVDEDIETVQSVDFQKKKEEIEDYCRKQYGDNTTLLVKNLQIHSDGEIKRNLKHLLKQFSIRDIELVDENIDDTILDWILNVNNEYVVESTDTNYLSFINM